MHDDISFTWPAVGTMQVTSLPSGGCNIKFVFADRGVVRSIGRGRIVKVRNIPTKRIAQQHEIIIRHDDDFESSYSIVDLTPNQPAGGADRLMMLGTDAKTAASSMRFGTGVSYISSSPALASWSIPGSIYELSMMAGRTPRTRNQKYDIKEFAVRTRSGEAQMDIRESILIEVLANGAVEQGEIEKRFGGLDIHEHVQWLVDAALLARSGSADKRILVRGKRLGPRR